MNENKLALHETLDLHELLSFKSVCATKSSTMKPLVKDSELRSLLEQDYETTKQHISELRGILENVVR